MQFLVHVKAKVTEKQIDLAYKDADGSPRSQTVTERHFQFPIFEGCRVEVLGHNPQAPGEQLWRVEGEQEKVLAQLKGVELLTLQEAQSLGWGAVALSELPLYEPVTRR